MDSRISLFVSNKSLMKSISSIFHTHPNHFQKVNSSSSQFGNLDHHWNLSDYIQLNIILISSNTWIPIETCQLFEQQGMAVNSMKKWGGALTRILSLPLNNEETLLISLSRSVGDKTSQTEPVTRNPFISHWLKHSLSSDSFLEHVCMIAPSPANSSTIACLVEHKDGD